MKNKIVHIKKTKSEKIKIKEIKFASEWFKCSSCGYTVRILVRGDVATCSQCGGRMYRC